MTIITADQQLDIDVRFRAMPIVLVSGYDFDGTYWGLGQPLWVVVDTEGEASYVRAEDQLDAFAACDIAPEYQLMTLDFALAQEYLTHLVWASAAYSGYSEADEGQSIGRYAIEIGYGAITEDREYTISEIRSIADCY